MLAREVHPVVRNNEVEELLREVAEYVATWEIKQRSGTESPTR